MKEVARRTKQGNTTHIIIVNVEIGLENLGGLSSLSYTQINTYCTAVLQGGQDRVVVLLGWFGIQYCTDANG